MTTRPDLTHRCPVRGCHILLPAMLLMCRPHWYMVPRAVRARVWDAYQGGRGLGTFVLADAQEEAIAAVHDKLEEARRREARP